MSTAIREQKEQQVAEIKEMLSQAKSFILVDYKGLSVAKDTELRAEFRKAGVRYHIFKNRLLKIALQDERFDEALNGPTAIAVGTEDMTAPAKILLAKAAAFKSLTIKCGMADGTYLNEEGCKQLATLPSREVLLSMFIGLLQAPIAGFARAIDAIAKQQQ